MDIPKSPPRSRPRGTGGAALACAAAAALVVLALRSERPGPGPSHDRTEAGATRSLTLQGRTPEELRRLWRDPSTLGRMLARFARVEADGPGRTRWETGPERWTMRLEDGDEVVWVGEDDALLRRLSVRFRDPVGQQGTVATLALELASPGGPLGRIAARAFGGALPSGIAISALHSFKALAETGEIPTTDHQPAARRDPR